MELEPNTSLLMIENLKKKTPKKLEQILSFFFLKTPATTASLEKGERNSKNVVLSAPFQIFISFLHWRELKGVFHYRSLY